MCMTVTSHKSWSHHEVLEDILFDFIVQLLVYNLPEFLPSNSRCRCHNACLHNLRFYHSLPRHIRDVYRRRRPSNSTSQPRRFRHRRAYDGFSCCGLHPDDLRHRNHFFRCRHTNCRRLRNRRGCRNWILSDDLRRNLLQTNRYYRTMCFQRSRCSATIDRAADTRAGIPNDGCWFHKSCHHRSA